MLNRYWRELAAICVLGLCVAAVIARVLVDPDGRLSPDSTDYLRIADEMSRGNWLWRPEAAQGDALWTYWALWPPAYPAAVSLLSQAFGLDAFMASKLLSLLCFGVAAATMMRFFGRAGAAFALLLANASTLTIFSHSWSEAPFVLVLLLFSISLTKAIERPDGTVLRHLAVPFALSVLLFELRYIGAFSVGALLAAAAITLRRSRRSAVLLAVAAVLAALVVLAHVRFNIEMTGFPTGMDRIPAPESNAELARELFRSLAKELLLPVTANYGGTLLWIGVALQSGLFAWLLASAVASPGTGREAAPATRASGFLLVGLLYLAAIIVVRWQSQFDPFSYRLLSPGTLLLFVFLLTLVLSWRPGLLNRVVVSLACLGLFSGVWIAREVMWRWDEPGYLETTRARLERYAGLAPGTILVSGDQHLNYLRPDLFVVEPDYAPYYVPRETWEDFRARLRPGLPVVIDAMTTTPWQGYHPAIMAFFAAQEEGALIAVDAAVDARIEALGE